MFEGASESGAAAQQKNYEQDWDWDPEKPKQNVYSRTSFFDLVA
jgi:hypothetical protein